MGLASEPNRLQAVVSTTDQTITGATAAQLTALPCGPSGKILVTAHPSNSTIIRVSGSDVAVDKGQPFGPGASYSFDIADASQLYAIIESGSGKLCVSAS